MKCALPIVEIRPNIVLALSVMFYNFFRSEFMRQFLLYGHVLSTEEAELYADYELKKNPPTLDNFKEQVQFLHDGDGISSHCFTSYYLECCSVHESIVLNFRLTCSNLYIHESARWKTRGCFMAGYSWILNPLSTH